MRILSANILFFFHFSVAAFVQGGGEARSSSSPHGGGVVIDPLMCGVVWRGAELADSGPEEVGSCQADDGQRAAELASMAEQRAQQQPPPPQQLVPWLLYARGADVERRDDPAFYAKRRACAESSAAPTADDDEWSATSWKQYAQAVDKTARALLALRDQQSPTLGETCMKVALFAEASPVRYCVPLSSCSVGDQ